MITALGKAPRMATRLTLSRAHRMLATHATDASKEGKKYPFGMHFHVSPIHKHLATAYGTMLWLWVFWRAKQDGKALLGLEHPWEHGHHDHHRHNDAAKHPRSFRYEKLEIGERPQLVQDS